MRPYYRADDRPDDVRKDWRAHEVVPETAETPAVMYVDLHLTHEVTSPQAFAQLRARGLGVRRPGQTLATLDHAVPTDTGQVFGGLPIRLESAAKQIGELERNAREFGFELLGLRDARRGIVHVIGPELGLTQPGMTIVCGDSHTSTHGAFGTLAFGIGTTEVAHVFATQCLLQRKPRTLAITVEGSLGPASARKTSCSRSSGASALPAARARRSSTAAARSARCRWMNA